MNRGRVSSVTNVAERQDCSHHSPSSSIVQSRLHEPEFSGFQKRLGIEVSEQLNEGRNQACPAGLMAGAQSGSSVAVEIFEEGKVVTPVWVVLIFLARSINRPFPLAVRQKECR